MMDADERRGADGVDGLPAPSNVFLAAADAAGFERTVTAPVDLSGHPDSPDALPADGTARFWGVGDGTRNANQFERMAPGDVVLFYRDGTYVGVGRVGTTLVDDGWAAATFWDDGPAERVYTLATYESVSVPRRAVNGMFGYDPDYAPGGLLGVADGRLPDPVGAVPVAVRRYDERHG